MRANAELVRAKLMSLSGELGRARLSGQIGRKRRRQIEFAAGRTQSSTLWLIGAQKHTLTRHSARLSQTNTPEHAINSTCTSADHPGLFCWPPEAATERAQINPKWPPTKRRPKGVLRAPSARAEVAAHSPLELHELPTAPLTTANRLSQQ